MGQKSETNEGTFEKSMSLDQRHLKNLVFKIRLGSVILKFNLSTFFFDTYVSGYVEKHKHAAYEFQYILEGAGFIKTDGEKLVFGPGSYFVIKPNVYHEQLISAEDSVHKYIIFIEYEMSNTRDELYLIQEEESIIEVLKNIVNFIHTDTKGIILLIEEIRQELCKQRIGYYTRIQSLLKLLVIEIVRNIDYKTKANYDIPNATPGESKLLIIENFFNNNYHMKVTSKNLADLLHVSTRQLSRILRESYHMTFMQKLIETRMELAKSMLKNTDISVKEISERVGYDSLSNFYVTFKQKNACTPSEYRYKCCKESEKGDS